MTIVTILECVDHRANFFDVIEDAAVDGVLLQRSVKAFVWRVTMHFRQFPSKLVQILFEHCSRRLNVLALITDCNQRENKMTSIDAVWQRIKVHCGVEFRQKGGKSFSYSIDGSTLVPSTTNRNLPCSSFEKALKLVPLPNTTCVQHLQGPSYIYAILMDRRIRLNDW